MYTQICPLFSQVEKLNNKNKRKVYLLTKESKSFHAIIVVLSVLTVDICP